VTHKAFLDKVRNTIDKYALLERGDKVLVALSGGQDSVALLHSLLQFAPVLSLTVEAAHFNHGIRGLESDRDQRFVENLCSGWGVHLEVGRGDIITLAQKRKRGLEEAAREARYDFLHGVMECRDVKVLALAHTLSEAVETFFMRLIRGASPYGLRGILPQKGVRIRPLIEVTRGEVERYLKALALPHVEDSSNRDLTHFRNWVRWKLLPLIKEQNPRIERSIGRFMDVFREESRYLEDEANKLLMGATCVGEDREVPLDLLRGMHIGLCRRVLLNLIHSMGGDVQLTHLDVLLRFISEEEKVEATYHLPRGIQVEKEREMLRFIRAKRTISTNKMDREVSVLGPGVCVLGSFVFEFLELEGEKADVETSPCSLLLDKEKVDFPFVIRYRKPGDAIYLRRVGHKKLQDLFVDVKMPRRQRKRWPVLVDTQNRILWVPGYHWDSRVVAGRKTQKFLLITLKEGRTNIGQAPVFPERN